MQELLLPTRHDWSAAENAYGKIAIDSFEPGFALTVGIAYRRALLSAIHGAAPTWVKIENVLHEFSHLPGVQEDTLDIMMNLRKVVFALQVNRPKILRLKAQGTRVVKAGDFEPDADVQILTPDVVLATLDKDGVLEMEVCVERGRGYQSPRSASPRRCRSTPSCSTRTSRRSSASTSTSIPWRAPRRRTASPASASCSRCGRTAA